MNDFEGWIPMRIYWRQARPMVDWGYLGGRRFTDPFFEQTIGGCVRHPADLLFRHQTPLEFLGELAENRPSLAPTGFIFHMSRCGSTLISQMLAAVPGNIVISEASPIDAILRAHFQDTNATEELRIKWLRWLLSALGRQRWPEEKYFFIKFDCWHAVFLPLIQRAFPGVPWIFIYREPVEVLMSHARQRGAHMIPRVLDPGVFGWDDQYLEQMALDEYGVRVLGRICEAALEQARLGRGKLVNYRQLPGIVWPDLMKYWGVDCAAEAVEAMTRVSRFNAKNPVLPFEDDTQFKRRVATEEIRRIARQWLNGTCEELEARRLGPAS
jgi:hypothetical protein